MVLKRLLNVHKCVLYANKHARTCRIHFPLGKKSDPTFQNKTTIGKNLYQYNRYRHRSLSLDQTYEIKSLIGPDTWDKVSHWTRHMRECLSLDQTHERESLSLDQTYERKSLVGPDTWDKVSHWTRHMRESLALAQTYEIKSLIGPDIWERVSH